jgi:hypothetical protein
VWERDHPKDESVNGSVTLNWILTKQNVGLWIEFNTQVRDQWRVIVIVATKSTASGMIFTEVSEERTVYMHGPLIVRHYKRVFFCRFSSAAGTVLHRTKRLS